MVSMDQIANQAAKMKYMFGGKAKLPLTITTTGGAGLGSSAAQPKPRSMAHPRSRT